MHTLVVGVDAMSARVHFIALSTVLGRRGRRSSCRGSRGFGRILIRARIVI